MKSGIIISLAVLITACHSRRNPKIRNNLISILHGSFGEDTKKLQLIPGQKQRNTKHSDDEDAKDARNKARVVQRAREIEDDLNGDIGILSQYTSMKKSGKETFHMDPVLNVLRRSEVPTRRKKKYSSSEPDTSSSSRELQNWKSEWNEEWMKKKLEALNSTGVKGDVVNMVAARPWGVPCGDPKQHDAPWGTCMLAAECDAEYRIYRGDLYCGRTYFICCALQLHAYDTYQGFDISFADSSLRTDSDEQRRKKEGSKERRRRRKARERRLRKKNREARKRKIKRHIRKIVKEVERILNRSYRNGTTIRNKKTRTLKKFIKHLKKKYRKDRDTVKDIHEIQLIKIDSDLLKRIWEVKDLNKNFMKNDTFRDIVMNGSMTMSGARMLVEAYPELSSFIGLDRTRRSGHADLPKDYLNYDIEYGLLYS